MIVSSSKFLQGSKPKLVSSASSDLQIEKKATQPGFLSRVGEDLSKRGQNVKESLARSEQGLTGKGQSPLETGFQMVGQGVGALGDVIGQGIQSIPGVQEGFEKFGETSVGQAVGDTFAKYETWAKENPRAAKNLESFVNIGSLFPAQKAASMAGQSTLKASKTVGKQILKTGEDIAEKIPKYAEKATQVLASEADPKVLTILKETPAETFDKYVALAEKAAVDPRAQTGFEFVGERMSDAAKQIEKQASSLGKQKSIIIYKARVGLEPFTEAPRKTILQLAKLEQSPVVKGLITKLKGVKNKIQADKWVDEAQDLIYSGTKNLTLAEGSTLEKQLKGIVGSFNESLKQTLPEAYRTLNTKYSNIAKVKKTLNRALGELVEGVPTRGASLVKQFFSPSGTKAKELFDFIKQKTGIDLAQDATLAKFTGEMFDDPRVRSLLQGIPQSKSGVIEKVLDFTVEKTGVGQKARDVIRQGTLKKARSKTIQKP